jgi:hypothetical protein
MGKAPPHKNKGKRGHKLSHKAARRTKSDLAPPDLMWKAFHLQTVKVGLFVCAEGAVFRGLCLLTSVPACVPSLQSEPPPQDEDLPGMGQFYCNVTGCAHGMRSSISTAQRGGRARQAATACMPQCTDDGAEESHCSNE